MVVALDGRVLPLGWADQLGLLEDDLLTSLRKAKRGQPNTVSRSHDEYNRDSRPLHKNTMPISVRQPSQAPTTARLQLGTLGELSQYR